MFVRERALAPPAGGGGAAVAAARARTRNLHVFVCVGWRRGDYSEQAPHRKASAGSARSSYAGTLHFLAVL